jgi:hypothetical protein
LRLGLRRRRFRDRHPRLRGADLAASSFRLEPLLANRVLQRFEFFLCPQRLPRKQYFGIDVDQLLRATLGGKRTLMLVSLKPVTLSVNLVVVQLAAQLLPDRIFARRILSLLDFAHGFGRRVQCCGFGDRLMSKATR